VGTFGISGPNKISNLHILKAVEKNDPAASTTIFFYSVLILGLRHRGFSRRGLTDGVQEPSGEFGDSTKRYRPTQIKNINPENMAAGSAL
jgi:hypothetical protein